MVTATSKLCSFWIRTHFLCPPPDYQADKETRRKQSNRDAARRSRFRKQAETEQTSCSVKDVARENDELTHRVGTLKLVLERLASERILLMQQVFWLILRLLCTRAQQLDLFLRSLKIRASMSRWGNICLYLCSRYCCSTVPALDIQMTTTISNLQILLKEICFFSDSWCKAFAFEISLLFELS